MKKMTAFIAMGSTAAVIAYGATLNYADQEGTEASNTLLTKIQIMEQLPVKEIKSHSINTFEKLKDFAKPQLDAFIQNKVPVLDLHGSGLDKSQQDLMMPKLTSMLSDKTSKFAKAYYENFTTAYAAVLMIRNMQDDGDFKLKNKIRLNQLKEKLTDKASNVDSSLDEVLNTPFEKFRQMTSKETLAYTFSVASRASTKTDYFKEALKSISEQTAYVIPTTSQVVQNINGIGSYKGALYWKN